MTQLWKRCVGTLHAEMEDEMIAVQFVVSLLKASKKKKQRPITTNDDIMTHIYLRSAEKRQIGNQWSRKTNKKWDTMSD